MKLLGLFWAVSCLCFSQEEGSKSSVTGKWPPQGTATIRAYSYTDFKEIARDGKLNESVVQPAGIRLDPKQEIELLSLLNAPYRKARLVYLCDSPRHGFVFFGPENQILGGVSICLACERIRTDTSLPMGNNYIGYAELLESLKIPLVEFKDAAEYKARRKEQMEE